MSLSHVLITRFSYRGKRVFEHLTGPTFNGDDPLNPERLAMRFELFELACLPAVLGQDEQQFAWVILVDRELPENHLVRLQSLVAARPQTFIHAFDPRSDLGSLGWLRPYLPESTGLVATTNLDDDDSLPAQFTATLRARLAALERAGQLPPIGIAGARQIVEWDLLSSRDAPLGWRAPWHREASVASAGLTLHCNVPAFDHCVLGLRHRFAEKYLRFSPPPRHPNIVAFQRLVSASARNAGITLEDWKPNAFFCDLSPEIGPVLMTNHASNDETRRLLEVKPGRTAVTGPSDFPGLPVDWEKARSMFRNQPAADDL